MVCVDKEKCIGCAQCAEVCSFAALSVVEGTAVFKDGSVCNECGHCSAACPAEAISVIGYDQRETMEYNAEQFTLPADNFLNALKFRRSSREFKEGDIAPEKIQKILEAGRYSPTASNRQPLRYIVLRRDTVKKISEIAYAAFKAATDDKQHRDELIQTKFKGIPRYYDMWSSRCKEYYKNSTDRLLFNAPCVIILASRKDDPWAAVDSAIAYANMDMMANTLGLGTCFVGLFEMAGGLDEGLYEFIGLDKDERPFVTFALGEPRVKYLRTVARKKPDITKI